MLQRVKNFIGKGRNCIGVVKAINFMLMTFRMLDIFFCQAYDIIAVSMPALTSVHKRVLH